MILIAKTGDFNTVFSLGLLTPQSFPELKGKIIPVIGEIKEKVDIYGLL